MRVAISTDNNFVSAHFGRCPFFTIVDIENNNVIRKEVLANPGHQPGLIPKFLHQHDVNSIVTGGMGMRATDFFNEFGIQTVVGVSGPIDEVIKKLQAGTLENGTSTCKSGLGKGYGLDKTECDHPHLDDCEHEGS